MQPGERQLDLGLDAGDLGDAEPRTPAGPRSAAAPTADARVSADDEDVAATVAVGGQASTSARIDVVRGRDLGARMLRYLVDQAEAKRRSAEREDVGAHPRVAERHLERARGDRVVLADELMHPRLAAGC